MHLHSTLTRLPDLPLKVPATIVLSFLTAIFLAAAHHCFYKHLDGTVVREAAFSQQFNIGVGTGFAFLVRSLLVLSIGRTYWQMFWRTLCSETLAIGNIDTLFGLLHNVHYFLKIFSLYRHPLLVCIAILAWTVPLAIIVPPGTLSVRSVSVQKSAARPMNIPLFDKPSKLAQTYLYTGHETLTSDSDAGSEYTQCRQNGSTILYNGPGLSLSRVTTATAYQGVLPGIAQPVINTSYTLSFNAPATKCIAAHHSVLSELGAFHEYSAKGAKGTWHSYDYLSWAPSRSMLVPLDMKGKFGPTIAQDKRIMYNQISGGTSNNSDGFSYYLGQYRELPPSLFVAYRWLRPEGQRLEALNCSFHDANYTVHFDFTNGNQSVKLLSIELLDKPLELSLSIWNGCKGGDKSDTVLTAKQVGYQALIESLGRVLVGTVSIDFPHHESPLLVADQTSVMKTNIAYSKQLAWLTGIIQRSGDDGTWTTGSYKSSAIDLSVVPNTGMTVGASIEELFHNMTLSLFSDSSLLSKSPFNINITTTAAENVYSYVWTQLVLAYGIAIAAALITVIIGCSMLFANGVAYSSDFSTFLRLVRGQHIDDIVAAYDDRRGADPLPRVLANAKIQISGIDVETENALRKSSSLKKTDTTVEEAEWKDSSRASVSSLQ